MKIDEIKMEIELQLNCLRFLQDKRERLAAEAENDYDEGFNRGMKTAYGVAIDTLEEILHRIK